MIKVKLRNFSSNMSDFRNFPKDYIEQDTLGKIIRLEEGERVMFRKMVIIPEQNMVISFHVNMLEKDRSNYNSLYEIDVIVTPFNKDLGFKNTTYNTDNVSYVMQGSAEDAYLSVILQIRTNDPEFFDRSHVSFEAPDVDMERLGQEVESTLDYYNTPEYRAEQRKRGELFLERMKEDSPF